MLINKSADPDVFRFVTDRNLLRQYDFLFVTIEVCLKTEKYPVHQQFLCDLNQHAVVYLTPHPGEIRECPIYIKNSNHSPPEASEVKQLLAEFFEYLSNNWGKCDAIHLSAYALWRINWIHPFVEGNGRTARAFSYFILCAKLGMLLPGRNIIPQQIRSDRTPYYDALSIADAAYTQNELNLSALEGYLSELLKKQLINE